MRCAVPPSPFDAGEVKHQDGIDPCHKQGNGGFKNRAAPLETDIARNQVYDDDIVYRHYQAHEPPAPAQFH